MRYKYKQCPRSLDQKIFDKIQQRRLQILLHSYLYYSCDTNVISDRQYDIFARELLTLQNENPMESECCEFYEYFKNFDANTGFDLPKFEWLQIIANRHGWSGTNRGR